MADNPFHGETPDTASARLSLLIDHAEAFVSTDASPVTAFHLLGLLSSLKIQEMGTFREAVVVLP